MLLSQADLSGDGSIGKTYEDYFYVNVILRKLVWSADLTSALRQQQQCTAGLEP